MYFDITYLVLVVPAIIFAMVASARVKSVYATYEKIPNSSRMTGAEAAMKMLYANGLSNVHVNCIGGELTDNYNPKTNEVNLSEKVYNGSSIAAVGVACHEVGHALQYANHYAPVALRMAIIPVTQIGSKLAMPLIIAGVVLTYFSEFFFFLVYVGIVLFALSTLFQLITLPVEFNASNRAMKAIRESSLLIGNEADGAKKVLSAAAMTYVAALAVSLTQLIRLLLIYGRRRR